MKQHLLNILSDIGFTVNKKIVKRQLDMAISDTTELSKKAHGIQDIYGS